MRKEKISGITEKHTEDKSEIDSSGKQENVENAPSKKSLKRVRFAEALEDLVYNSATTVPTPQKELKSCLREPIATSIPIKKRRLVNTKTTEYREKYDLKKIKPINISELQSSVVSQPMSFFDNPSDKAKLENGVVKKEPTPSESNSFKV